MLYASKEAFLKTDEERDERIRMWLEMFNGSDSDEWSAPKDFCIDLYNLCYVFADVRTLLAKSPDVVPIKNELLLGFALARLNVLRHFPYLLKADLVNRSFSELETLFDLAEVPNNSDSKRQASGRTDALAVTHFFHNTLHNFYLMQTRGLIDFDRLLGQLRPPLPIYAHIPPPKYLQ